MTDLKTKDGVCASGQATLVSGKVTTCIRTGMPGTLYDDATTRVISTVASSANGHDSDTGEWQVEVLLDGNPLLKRMMAKNWPPQLSCVLSPCHSYSVDTMPLEQVRPGVYVFRYTFGLDTSWVVTNTIVLQ